MENRNNRIEKQKDYLIYSKERVNVYFIALSSVNMLFSKTGLVIAPFIKKLISSTSLF